MFSALLLGAQVSILHFHYKQLKVKGSIFNIFFTIVSSAPHPETNKEGHSIYF